MEFTISDLAKPHLSGTVTDKKHLGSLLSKLGHHTDMKLYGMGSTLEFSLIGENYVGYFLPESSSDKPMITAKDDLNIEDAVKIGYHFIANGSMTPEYEWVELQDDSEEYDQTT